MELCIALDLPSKKENLELLKTIRILMQKDKKHKIWVKVGLRSFIRDGKEFLQEIKEIDRNFKIFLDLKLYDIPNTMMDSVREMIKLEVDMLTLHASSGKEAMCGVMECVKEAKKPPLVMAVTALTSFDADSFFTIYHACLLDQILEFAKTAKECGVNGVVCSCAESKMIKAQNGVDFLTLTPAIRPFGEESGDQKRVATLKDAKEAESDFIVVGRPIYKVKNPEFVVERILNNL